MEKATWLIHYFDNSVDKEPSRSVIIEAVSENEAVERAVAAMHAYEMRLDVIRTVQRDLRSD